MVNNTGPAEIFRLGQTDEPGDAVFKCSSCGGSALTVSGCAFNRPLGSDYQAIRPRKTRRKRVGFEIALETETQRIHVIWKRVGFDSMPNFQHAWTDNELAAGPDTRFANPATASPPPVIDKS